MSRENKCPWCEDEIQDLWEYNLEDGDAEDFDCPSCNKKVTISLCVSYDFTIKATGCEKHVLELDTDMSYYSGNKFVVFGCKLCKNRFYDHDLPPPIGKYDNLKEDTYVFTPEADAALKRVLEARVSA